MAKVDDDFQLYPCFNGLPSESLEDYTFEVEALVARLVRGVGGIPGALARESCTCQTSQNLRIQTDFGVP